MMVGERRSFFLALVVVVLGATARVPAQQRIAVADPALAYRVEGDVRLANGRPAVGVVVERTTDAAGRSPRGGAGDRLRTDARGHFLFTFDGFGWPEGPTWYLAVRRVGCPGTVATVTLHEGRVPPRGSPGDVATGIVIRLPACARDR